MSRSVMAIRVVATSALSVLLALDAAAAMSCDRWLRLDSEEKAVTVERMIDDALSGNRGRKYDVNREGIARCLQNRASEIAIAFDDVCSNSRNASMQAIREVFDTYVWSCVG